MGIRWVVKYCILLITNDLSKFRWTKGDRLLFRQTFSNLGEEGGQMLSLLFRYPFLVFRVPILRVPILRVLRIGA